MTWKWIYGYKPTLLRRIYSPAQKETIEDWWWATEIPYTKIYFFLMTALSYPGGQRLLCAVSGFGHVFKKWPARKAISPLVSPVFARRRVGLRPTKLLVAREKKTSGTQGSPILELIVYFNKPAYQNGSQLKGLDALEIPHFRFRPRILEA